MSLGNQKKPRSVGLGRAENGGTKNEGKKDGEKKEALRQTPTRRGNQTRIEGGKQFNNGTWGKEKWPARDLD